LRELAGASYEQEPLLAPTQELLDEAKKPASDWPQFERRFHRLMKQRQIETALRAEDFKVPTALLCSEASPERCHRRLVAEYLGGHWADLHVTDL
jgi:uncharacterized protein YeaO (DUF488 family)